MEKISPHIHGTSRQAGAMGIFSVGVERTAHGNNGIRFRHFQVSVGYAPRSFAVCIDVFGGHAVIPRNLQTAPHSFQRTAGMIDIARNGDTTLLQLQRTTLNIQVAFDDQFSCSNIHRTAGNIVVLTNGQGGFVQAQSAARHSELAIGFLIRSQGAGSGDHMVFHLVEFFHHNDLLIFHLLLGHGAGCRLPDRHILAGNRGGFLHQFQIKVVCIVVGKVHIRIDDFLDRRQRVEGFFIFCRIEGLIKPAENTTAFGSLREVIGILHAGTHSSVKKLRCLVQNHGVFVGGILFVIADIGLQAFSQGVFKNGNLMHGVPVLHHRIGTEKQIAGQLADALPQRDTLQNRQFFSQLIPQLSQRIIRHILQRNIAAKNRNDLRIGQQTGCHEGHLTKRFLQNRIRCVCIHIIQNFRQHIAASNKIVDHA